MANSNHTERALFSSIFTILLCVVVFIGNSFAWFTDSVSSGVNKIESGTLKLGVYRQNVNNTSSSQSITDVTNLFSLGTGENGDPITWVPGKTASETFTVKNNGDITFNYDFYLYVVVDTQISASTTLAQTLQYSVSKNNTTGGEDDENSQSNSQSLLSSVSATSESKNNDTEYYTKLTSGSLLANGTETFTVTITWPNNQGNDLTGGASLQFYIKVVATQTNSTENSFNGSGFSYNSGSSVSSQSAPVVVTNGGSESNSQTVANNGITYVGSADEFRAALNNLNVNGGTIILTQDIDLANVAWNYDLTVPAGKNVVINGDGHYIRNLNSTGAYGGLIGQLNVGSGSTVVLANLTLENVTLQCQDMSVASPCAGSLIGYCLNNGENSVTVSQVGVENVSVSSYTYSGGLIGYVENSANVTNCYALNGSVSGTQFAGGLIGRVSDQGGSGCVSLIQNCTVEAIDVSSSSGSTTSGAVAGAVLNNSTVNCIECANVTVDSQPATDSTVVGINSGSISNVLFDNTNN